MLFFQIFEQKLESFLFAFWRKIIQKDFLLSFRIKFLLSFWSFSLNVVHPILVGHFIKDILSELLKLLIVSVLIFAFLVDSILYFVDKSHYQIVVVAIIAVFELNWAWRHVVIG